VEKLTDSMEKAAMLFPHTTSSTSTAGFICGTCGREFMPDHNSYIGPKDPRDTSCSPFVNFIYICSECNK
jgi:DNA-directed RNA polymerase subunit RPC12/RpoP